MDILRKVMDKVLEVFMTATLGIMTILVTWQVITRFFLNKPSAVTEQTTQYLFVWLVIVGGAYVFGKREHMRIVFLETKINDLGKKILAIFQEAVVLVFAAGVLVYGGYTISMTQMAQVDASLQIPMGVIYFALFIGGIFTVVYSILNILDIIKNKISL